MFVMVAYAFFPITTTVGGAGIGGPIIGGPIIGGAMKPGGGSNPGGGRNPGGCIIWLL